MALLSTIYALLLNIIQIFDFRTQTTCLKSVLIDLSKKKKLCYQVEQYQQMDLSISTEKHLMVAIYQKYHPYIQNVKETILRYIAIMRQKQKKINKKGYTITKYMALYHFCPLLVSYTSIHYFALRTYHLSKGSLKKNTQGCTQQQLQHISTFSRCNKQMKILLEFNLSEPIQKLNLLYYNPHSKRPKSI